MVQEQVRVGLAPITDADVGAVAAFLHDHLNSRLSVGEWQRCAMPLWQVDAPNHGFMLRHEGRVVGVYLAFYSERPAQDGPRRICNLAAWCVLDEHRSHGVRLVRALLRQRGYEFVDLSPSGNVVDLNRRLGFEVLDTATSLVPNLPLPRRPACECWPDPPTSRPPCPGPSWRSTATTGTPLRRCTSSCGSGTTRAT